MNHRWRFPEGARTNKISTVTVASMIGPEKVLKIAPTLGFIRAMPKTTIRPAGLHDTSPRAYSQAVRVGNTVYIAGQMATDVGGPNTSVRKGDVATQGRRIFANIEKIVRSAGGELDDIVSMTVFLRDMSDLSQFLEVRRAIFKKDFPASTAIQVAALADKEGLVEVNAIAVIDD